MKLTSCLQRYFKRIASKFAIFSMALFLLCFSGNIFPAAGIFLICLGAAWFRWLRNTWQTIGSRDAIVITGCDSGLGYSLALHCHNHLKLRVLAGVHSKKSSGAQNLTGNGIHVLPIELTDPESINTFAKCVKERLKEENIRLRALVNNAGMMVFGEFEWQTDQQTSQQIEVNLLGTMRLTKFMLPILREHKSRLIVVTSHCASEALPGVATYGATKAALSGWATSLRVELKKFNIDVVCFVPGSFVLESNILSQQVRHFQTMRFAMNEETNALYDNYFQRYAEYLSSLSRDNSLRTIQNDELYEIFEDALLQEYPRAVYTCEPWRYKLYHFLFKIMPMNIRDYLVEKFVQMPSWKTENKDSNEEKKTIR